MAYNDREHQATQSIIEDLAARVEEEKKRRHKCFSSENDTYEFYYGGTNNDALQVKHELERDYGLKGDVFFNTTYGWMVRVKKN